MDTKHPRRRIATLLEALARFRADATTEWINRIEDYRVRERFA